MERIADGAWRLGLLCWIWVPCELVRGGVGKAMEKNMGGKKGGGGGGGVERGHLVR